MKRIAINASPRGRLSNSRVILGWLLEGVAKVGVAKVGGDETEIVDLAGPEGEHKALEAFIQADEILLAFPLYTDFVPGILKAFLERLAGAPRESLAGKRVAFVVHSGFPESIQAEKTRDWLERAIGRLGMSCQGAMIKGGSEGFRLMPRSMTRPAARLFSLAGESLARYGSVDPRIIAKLAVPRRLSPFARLALSLAPSGAKNMYWDMMLRKHHAEGRKFDAPYGEPFA